MKVSDLIAKLSALPQDSIVYTEEEHGAPVAEAKEANIKIGETYLHGKIEESTFTRGVLVK